MDVILWIIAVVLAAVFLAAGITKLRQPLKNPSASGTGQLGNLSPTAVKAIGVLEVLAAVGLLLPAIVDIAPILVPLAALGVALLMVGAAITHARRREAQMIAVNVLLFVLAAVVVWGRLGPFHF
ncbi:DoxX family protein [Actinoplanes sp. Pm04-4]|uniref:DoxX family protein n=1 Tax=Paractinoplanes pyxinae TaxID=2997416 RepID=A0ABT4B783_9ACTN|nr:DoxX family protein [Actinoplanes pyxinae]MCY1141450.1 DoxX family protein [Actinoplanes pyxinae]